MSRNETDDSWFGYTVTRRHAPGDAANEVIFYTRRRSRPTVRRRITERDLFLVVLLSVYCACAIALPARWWPAVCRFCSQIRLRRHVRKSMPAFARSLAAVTGETDPATQRALFRDMRAAAHRSLMLFAAERFPRRWRPAIDIRGFEGVSRALARGRGAIIWAHPLMAQNLIGKRALHSAGLPCNHVSVAEHGFSHSGFAIRFLNPALIGRENRYLASRIVFEPDQPITVTRRIERTLRANGVVLLVHNVHAGSAFAQTRAGPAGYMPFATTAVAFAVRSGAALFMMSTFETAALRDYESVVSPEITPPDAPVDDIRTPRARDEDRVAAMLLQARDFAVADLKRAPDQFLWWGRQHRPIVV